MMVNFLQVTKDEINEAKSGGMPVFKDNDPVRFLVEGAKLNEADSRLTFSMQVIGGDNDGKKMSIYIDNNPMGKRRYIALMSAYFSEEELINGSASYAELIGKKVDTVAKIKQGTGSNAGKTYTNFYDYKPVSDVPDEVEEAVSNAVNSIPSEQSAGQDIF